jgi:hypothetical protein
MELCRKEGNYAEKKGTMQKRMELCRKEGNYVEKNGTR